MIFFRISDKILVMETKIKNLLAELQVGNGLGEEVTLVAATKTRTAEEINRAIRAGIEHIGENKVQEFRDKYDGVQGAHRHFIGRLQTNKVKYLIGKTYLIHSVDRAEIAEEIAKRSRAQNVISDILIQINIGCEESKGGFAYENGFPAWEALSRTEGLRVRGFMAMLPLSDDCARLEALCDKMRALYERAKAQSADVTYLSMGMSGDWRLCLSCGANMIRLGTAIFGERN